MAAVDPTVRRRRLVFRPQKAVWDSSIERGHDWALNLGLPFPERWPLTFS
jgi:hypothetical protein